MCSLKKNNDTDYKLIIFSIHCSSGLIFPVFTVSTHYGHLHKNMFTSP
jgi:hypothetical protein